MPAGAADVRLPQGLAVACFDDLPYSRSSSPALTSVHLPAGPLAGGRASSSWPFIEGRALEHEHIVLDSYLRIREPTAPRP